MQQKILERAIQKRYGKGNSTPAAHGNDNRPAAPKDIRPTLVKCRRPR